MYVQFPSEPTVVSTVLPPCKSIFTVAPAIPVPEILRSVEPKSPLKFALGVTVGAGGVTLTGTVMILDGCLLVASGASLPL